MATAASLVVRVSAQIAEFQKSFADINRTTSKFASEFEGIATRAAAVGTFIGNIATKIASSLARAFTEGLKDAIRLSSEFSNAFIGLNSVARAFGADADQATAAAKRLSSDGLLPLKDSATGLKNLLAAGFNLEQATNLMNAFKDSAAFGRQGALSFGDAVRSATEGVKNGNSILVDNAGVTKNLSNILKEAGFSAQDLSRVQSDAAVRLALYNGILRETVAFQGDAERLTQTYSGAVSRLSFAYDNLLVTIGSAITQNATVARVIQGVADAFFGLNTQLTNNRQAFNFVSDGVVFLVRAFAETLHVIDLVQTGFAGLQQVSNRIFEAFINIAIAAFKVVESAAGLQKWLDPGRWQQHTAVAASAAAVYKELEANAQGLRDASKDAEARSASFGNTLQGVRAKANDLATELEKTRGKTVELGEQAAPKMAAALSAASDTTKSFEKNLKELTAEIELARRHGTGLATLVEVFGSAAEKAATKADAWGIAVKASVRDVAEAFRQAKFDDFLVDFFDKQAKANKKHWDGVVKQVEEAGERAGKAFVANFDVQRSAFKDIEKFEADSLEKRLRAVSRDADDRRALLNKNASNYQSSLAVIDDLERRSAELATRAWEEHVFDTEQSLNTFTNIFKRTLQGIPDLIKSAFTGGGGFSGALSSITSGLGSDVFGKLFGELAAKLSNTFSRAFGIGVTSALGTIIPGIGAALGSLITPDFFKRLSKKLSSGLSNIADLVGLGWEKDGRKLVEQFAAGFGGFDALQRKLQDTLDPETAHRFWVALTQGVGRDNPEQAQKAIDDINAALGRQSDRLAGATAILAEYGLTWEDAGAKFKNANLAAQFDALHEKTLILKDIGVDYNLILDKQAGEYSKLLQAALRTGSEIPIAFKPILEDLLLAGKLLREDGTAFNDLADVSWAKTLTQGFKDVTKAIYDLRDALVGGVGGALDELSKRRVTIPIGFDIDSVPLPDVQLEHLGSGGIVRRPTLALVGESGPEAVIPLSQLGNSHGGGTQHITLVVSDEVIARAAVRGMPRELVLQGQ